MLTDFALISAAIRINDMAPFLSTEFDLQNTATRGAGMFPGTEAICPATLRRGAHQSRDNVDLPRCSRSEIQGHGSSVPEGLAPEAERLRCCAALH